MLLILALLAALLDDWPGAQVKEVFSESRDYFVRVIPGKSVGDTIGFAGSPKGPYATAEFYRREKDRSYRLSKTITLENPVAPADFFVTDHGYLMTLDNWHNLGYGKVVVVYSPEGVLIRPYRLQDLFSEEEVNGFQHSVSSIWWRKTTYVRQDQRTLYMMIAPGHDLVLEENGAYQYCETRKGTYLCRDSNENRHWRSYKD